MVKISRSRFSNLCAAALVGSAAFTLVSNASAQFSTNFNSGYQAGATLSDQNGWTTNDEDTGSTYSYPGGTGTIGQSDSVGPISGFSTSTADNSPLLGGYFAPGTVPGAAVVNLNHGLALGGSVPTVQVDLDYGVTQSNPNGFFPSHDTFGFALTGTAGNLFSINFVPSSDPTFDNITFTTSTGTFATGSGFSLGQKLHLILRVNTANSTFSATIAGIQVVTNQAFTGGSVAGLSALWSLADTASRQTGVATTGNAPSTAYTDPGSNYLAFDNIVTSVPEPSTYALLGAGVLCLAAVIRRRVA